MRRYRRLPMIAVAGVLACGLATPAVSGGVSFSVGLGFAVGGASFHVAYASPRSAYTPHYYRTAVPLRYRGYECASHCLKGSGYWYHVPSCPLVGHHFARFGYSGPFQYSGYGYGSYGYPVAPYPAYWPPSYGYAKRHYHGYPYPYGYSWGGYVGYGYYKGGYGGHRYRGGRRGYGQGYGYGGYKRGYGGYRPSYGGYKPGYGGYKPGYGGYKPGYGGYKRGHGGHGYVPGSARKTRPPRQHSPRHR